MTGLSFSAADALVERLFAVTVRTGNASEGLDCGADTPAERASADMAAALVQWFGPYGYHALITRALADARAAHPALEHVRVRAPNVPVLDGFVEAVRTHGGDAVHRGTAALLSALIGVVGRVIGEEMALQLVERNMRRPERGALEAPVEHANQPTDPPSHAGRPPLAVQDNGRRRHTSGHAP